MDSFSPSTFYPLPYTFKYNASNRQAPSNIGNRILVPADNLLEDVRTVGDDTVDTRFDEPLHVIF